MRIKDREILMGDFKQLLRSDINENSIKLTQTDGVECITKLIDDDILTKLLATTKSQYLSEYETEIYVKLANDTLLRSKNLLLYSFLLSKSVNFKQGTFDEDLEYIRNKNI